MKSRAKNLGLMGLILGSSIFSGCVSNADNLYRTGQINAQQHAQMKAAESQRDDGLIFTALGTLMGLNGIRTGNVERAFAGESMRNYGIAQASANNTNVYVSTAPQQVAPSSYIPEVQVQMPEWKITKGISEEPLFLESRSEITGKVFAVISNYALDLKKDGKLDYPEDFRGLKRTYLPGEDITLSLIGEKTSELTVRVYDQSGREAYSDSASKSSLSSKFKGDNGKYRAEFYLGKSSIGNLEFEINPDKVRFEKR